MRSELRLRARSTLLFGGCFSDGLIVWWLVLFSSLSFLLFLFFLVLLFLADDVRSDAWQTRWTTADVDTDVAVLLLAADFISFLFDVPHGSGGSS